LKAIEAAARRLRTSVGSFSTPKLTGSRSSIMKEIRPTRIDSTVQAGFQLSGWKSVMLRQSRWFVANLPLGVSMTREGGAKG